MISMVNYTIYDAIDTLADKYIPDGNHTMLHINSRDMWKRLMKELLEKDSIPRKLSFLTKCAINWEALLSQRQSLLN